MKSQFDGIFLNPYKVVAQLLENWNLTDVVIVGNTIENEIYAFNSFCGIPCKGYTIEDFKANKITNIPDLLVVQQIDYDNIDSEIEKLHELTNKFIIVKHSGKKRTEWLKHKLAKKFNILNIAIEGRFVVGEKI